jgi:hypothetical protein
VCAVKRNKDSFHLLQVLINSTLLTIGYDCDYQHNIILKNRVVRFRVRFRSEYNSLGKSWQKIDLFLSDILVMETAESFETSAIFHHSS